MKTVKDLIKEQEQEEGWIGVDLDGTLAEYQSGYASQNKIGKPIPKMLVRIEKWLGEGKTIKIFTARAYFPESIPYIKKYLNKIGLPDLEITNIKDPYMIELWDDRVVQVIPNTGNRADGK